MKKVSKGRRKYNFHYSFAAPSRDVMKGLQKRGSTIFALSKQLGVCLVLLSALFFNACTGKIDLNRVEEKKTVALITKTGNDDYWKTVKMGADAAAREFGIDIDFAAPQEEVDIEEQIRLVNLALEKKVDALVLAAGDYTALAEVTAKAFDQRIPVIIIDSEVNTPKFHSYVAADNLEAGRRSGEKLIEIVGKESRVVLMSFVKGSRNAQQREEGFLQTISQYPQIKMVAREYCLSDSRLAEKLLKGIIEEQGPIDAVVALNAPASVGVAKGIDDMNLSGKVKVIAFDSTIEEIDYIDKDVIQATIVQNPFTMGYLGIKYAVDAMTGKKIPKRVDTGIQIIDKDNLYLPENQKLLFPFVK